MDYKEQIDFIRILRTDGIGNITFQKLISKYNLPSKAIEFLENSSKVKIASKDIAEKELSLAEKFGAKILFSTDDNFPKLLKQIPDSPQILCVLGNISCLSHKSVGVVGSRNASLNSKMMTSELSRELVDNDYTVVSGMAMGIDAYAHIGALSSKNLEGEKTVAVLAGGVDKIYPLSNTKIYHEIIENGAVVSEMPIGVEPQGKLFPRRNRIISGLSKGTVVMEAGIKSGTLITTRFAIEQNREVFAVPNFPKDPRAGGCNMLIKNGAHLTENVFDIVNILNELPDDRVNKNSLFAGVYEDALEFLPELEGDFENLDVQNKILSLLSHTPISLDSLIRELEEFKEAEISNALLNLELDDKIAYPSVGKIILKLS